MRLTSEAVRIRRGYYERIDREGLLIRTKTHANYASAALVLQTNNPTLLPDIPEFGGDRARPASRNRRSYRSREIFARISTISEYQSGLGEIACHFGSWRHLKYQLVSPITVARENIQNVVDLIGADRSGHPEHICAVLQWTGTDKFEKVELAPLPFLGPAGSVFFAL